MSTERKRDNFDRAKDATAARDSEGIPQPKADEFETISAADLLAKEFPEPRWIVPSLILEGFFLLAGRPKIGKSWLALLLAVCKAGGLKFLGHAPAERGGVLYLALEDSQRRIKKRLLLMGGTAPEGLHFRFKMPQIGKGGLKTLERWLDEHPDVVLVIIDTYGKVRDSKPKNGDPYQHDVEQAGQLQELAMRRGISLFLVHHDRKAGAEDWLETVSGTFGLTGTADSVALLQRERDSANARLRVTGRDVEDADLALLFENCRWSVAGPGGELTLSPERRKILEFLRKEGGKHSPTVIHLATGLKLDTVRHALPEMRDFVAQPSRGYWKAK